MTPPRYLRPTGLLDVQARRSRLRLMGPVSLVIAASTVFCLTCLLYLWQDSEITTATARVAHLQQVLVQAQETNKTLSAQASRLQSPSRVEAEATRKYGMQLVQEDHVQWVPPVVLTPIFAANSAGRSVAGRQAAASAGLPRRAGGPLDAWWQAASHALGALFR